MVRFILTLILFYIVVRVISGLFLSSSNGKKSNAKVFYNAFKNVRNKQKQQKEQSKGVENRLDEIEEAEYEDITENDTKSSSQN